MGSFGITGTHSVAACKGPGVTVGRSGASIGAVSFIASDYWPLNTCLYVKNFKGNDPRFCYYFLKTFDLARLNSGSAQPSLNRNFVHPVQASFPPPCEQRAIASTLGALDDKIDLNRRMNETLEAMARALFKDWFVDFGPTRAKMEGRAPYLAPDIWALFPDRLDDEGKPEGWTAGRLDDLLVLQRGFDLPATRRTDGPYPVIAASGINGTHAAFMVRGPGVTTGRSGVLGKVFYVQEDFWPLNTSLWVKQYKAASPLYAYFLLQRLDFESFNAGSAVPTLNRNHVHSMPLVLPRTALVEAFDAVCLPMMERLRKNEEENETLAATRDLLLPKLMSGEIRVRDAERVLEAVA